MKKALAFALALALALASQAQQINHVDPLECPIIGFNVGVMSPAQGPMYDLYKPPYLSFGMDFAYKWENNFLLTLDGNIFMGSDNLRHRTDRMSDIFSRDSIIIGENGVDANVTCYNRGLSLKAGMGYIVRLTDKNPNSGILLKATGGLFTNRTIFMLNDQHAPQIEPPYNRLYDHRRMGFMLTESVGCMFMSNHKTLVNIYAAFEVSQAWSHSTRPFVIDNYLGLNGPDNSRYFDLIYSVKLCWMFPLTGKPAYDYYY